MHQDSQRTCLSILTAIEDQYSTPFNIFRLVFSFNSGKNALLSKNDLV